MFESILTLLQEALRNAQSDWRNDHGNYTNPQPGDDRDDIRWAYEAQLRAEHLLRQLGIRNFDECLLICVNALKQLRHLL